MLLKINRDRAATSLDDFDFLLECAVQRLTDRLLDFRRRFNLILNLGGRTGLIDNFWPKELPKPTLIHTDISEKMAARALSIGPALVCDEELLPFSPESLDAVISCLSLHWVNDLPGVFQQIRRVLKPDGLLLTSMFGGKTLFELRESLNLAEIEIKGGISPRVSPFANLQDLAHLLQRAGLALPVADTDTIIVKYDNIFELIQNLRGMGETNTIIERSRQPPPRELFVRAGELYAQKFGDGNNRIPATFEILTGTGWAPHASQQTPLIPGSGKIHFSKVLDT
tara:strand:- start:64 stop:912 length:849 start_codon:yes stop_codon:yes gene_type:complete